MSNHLLKFAVTAKFLHPPMDDSEFLQAIRGHYPFFVQRCWITGHIKTIQDAISFLKQLESVGEQDTIKTGNVETTHRSPGNAPHY
jgi:hypothetical protein